jgi:hypothetical protein
LKTNQGTAHGPVSFVLAADGQPGKDAVAEEREKYYAQAKSYLLESWAVANPDEKEQPVPAAGNVLYY